MHTLVNKIGGLVFAALALVAMPSCVMDDIQDDPVMPEQSTMLNVGIRIPAMRPQADGNTRADGYEQGVGFENYIDLSVNAYRIYFFDGADKFVAKFDPILVTENSTGTDLVYEMLGKLPAELFKATEFKLVVLANWPSYPEDATLAKGVTTIDDICKGASATFDCKPGFLPDPAKNQIIPFFGVHHYTGVKFEQGLNKLAEPVSLLRALAKVEVCINIDNVSFSSIGITGSAADKKGFNTKGFCAPAGVYSHTDYDHSGVWEQDYVRAVHLVDGQNEILKTGDISQVPMTLEYEKDETHPYETWVAYIPEYRNTGADAGSSKIKLKLDVMDASEAPLTIEFADYDVDGKLPQTGQPTYFDIERNNCYRFIVSLEAGGLVIKVRKWDNTYDNFFEFK